MIGNPDLRICDAAGRTIRWFGIALCFLASYSVANGQGQTSPPSPVEPAAAELQQRLMELQAVAEPFHSSPRETQSEFRAQQRQRLEIARQLCDTTAEPALKRLARQNQLESLRLLIKHGEPRALEQLWDLSRQLATGDDAEIRSVAEDYLRRIMLQNLLAGDTSPGEALFNEVMRLLETTSQNTDLQFSIQAARGLELAERGLLAKQIYLGIQRVLQQHELADSDNLADQVQQALSRLSLVGSRLEIAGALFGSGQQLQQPRAGSVILLDFWASWCAPCRREMPAIRALLDRYQDRGFTVLGVCLDEDRDAARRFLDGSQDINWPTLYETEPAKHGFQHPLAVALGVTQLPTAVLLDAEGHILSVTARGENLSRWLAKLYDEPRIRRSPLRPEGLWMTRGQNPVPQIGK